MWRRVKRAVSMADVVLEVVDARDPLGTRCKRVERLARARGKKLIIVINKSDLVPRGVLERWKELFSKEFPTIYVSAKSRLGTKVLRNAVRKYAPKLPIKVAVVGYPNVGKSTIINALKGRHVAETSPRAGETKGERLVRVSSWFKLIDSPGVVPVADDVDKALKCIAPPEEISDPVLAAMELIKRGLQKNKRLFEKKYGVKSKDPEKVIEELARRRGLIRKGGKLAVDEAARTIIRDWQAGELVFYYTPEDYGLLKSGGKDGVFVDEGKDS